MKKYIWVGPRESDIESCSIKFDATITWYGDGKNNCSYLKKKNVSRNEYCFNGRRFIDFIEETISQNYSHEDYQIMFYNPLQYYLISDKSNINAICINKLDILNTIRNKGIMRNYVNDIVNIVPFISFHGNNIPEFNSGANKIILQECISSGGNGTFLLSPRECGSFLQQRKSNTSYIVSPYLEDSIPINVHLVVFDDGCIVFPVSHQIIFHEKNKFKFMGADFHTDFSSEIYNRIIENSNKIGNRLKKFGYRGVCGIDYLIHNNEVLFLEVNPRFQASTFLLNELLQKEHYPTIQELSILAFNNGKKPFDSFCRFKERKSYFNVIDNDIKYRQIYEKSSVSILTDGYSFTDSINDNYYYRFRIVKDRNISWIDYDGKLLVAPNVLPDTKQWKERIINNDLLALKISLLNQGVRISRNALEQMKANGMIRQGVFQSVDITFNKRLIINAPYLTDFSELSPYEIDYYQGEYVLKYYNKILHSISFDPLDENRKKVAHKGTIFGNIAFLATDRLRVHHQFRCNFKLRNLGCKFCNVKPKEGDYNLDDVFEVIDYYIKNVEFRHFLIGGGSGVPEVEQHNIMEIAKHIKSKCSKPIYAMCLPPENIEILDCYKGSGIDEIAFNIEIFNRTIARRTMPGKGTIPLEQYKKAFLKAVSLWGKTGNVRSMLVLGLEPLNDFYKGFEWLCQMGVMPIVSVFRPVNHIVMKSVLPYSNNALYEIYLKSKKIASKYSLYPGPPCIACQNNTLSIPEYQSISL